MAGFEPPALSPPVQRLVETLYARGEGGAIEVVDYGWNRAAELTVADCTALLAAIDVAATEWILDLSGDTLSARITALAEGNGLSRRRSYVLALGELTGLQKAARGLRAQRRKLVEAAVSPLREGGKRAGVAAVQEAVWPLLCRG